MLARLHFDGRCRRRGSSRRSVDQKQLIETDGHGKYRLSTAPENVTVDEAPLRSYHGDTLKQVGWS